MSSGLRCRCLLFSSNNSLLAKVKRSPFPFKGIFWRSCCLLTEMHETKVCGTETRCGWPHRGGKKMTLPWPLLCTTKTLSTGSCLVNPGHKQMLSRYCPGPTSLRAKIAPERPRLRFLASLWREWWRVRLSRSTAALLSQMGKLQVEETVFFLGLISVQWNLPF